MAEPKIMPDMPATSKAPGQAPSATEAPVPPSTAETGDETQGLSQVEQNLEPKSPPVEEQIPLEEEVLTTLPPEPPPPSLEEKSADVPPATQTPAKPPPTRNTMYQRALQKVKEEEDIEKAAKLKEEEEEAKSPKEPLVVEVPPAPEIRAAPYVTRPSPKILYKIERELRDDKYYLMGKRVFGDPKAPDSCTFFVMGDIGKRYQVKIRQFPACQCGDFLEDRLCKHMMFVMLKFFKLQKYDPLNWQRAYLSTELRSLLSDPRITSSPQIEAKKKFVSKLFPPKVSPTSPSDESSQLPLQSIQKPEKAVGPQFCPICLEQFNFIAETPKIPYIGPIPWKPKFMPKLDMAPPKSIKELRENKARLNNAIKKHEEEMALAKQEKANIELEEPKEDLEAAAKQNIEAPNKSGEDESHNTTKSGTENGQENNDGKTTILTKGEEKKDDPIDSTPPLRKYEPIWFCPDSDCKGDAACFKLVHEWCYKKYDNYGIYPRGKQCPNFSSL